eukprot:jgi/Bigna1/87802/estExt_fgenesh1_pg.C_240140
MVLIRLSPLTLVCLFVASSSSSSSSPLAIFVKAPLAAAATGVAFSMGMYCFSSHVQVAHAEETRRPVLGETDASITGDLMSDKKNEKETEKARTDKDEMGNALPKANPGKFEQVGKEAKGGEVLALDVSDGARVSLQLPVYQSQEKLMAIQHMMWLGTSFIGESKGFYEFTSILQTNKLVMTGAIDSLWRLQGRAIGMMGKRTMARLQFQMCPEAKIPDQVTFKADYSGEDFSITFDSANIMDQVSLSYLQKITENVSVGSQLAFVPVPPPDKILGPLTFVARYKNADTTLSGNVCNVQDKLNLGLSYARKVDKHCSVAAEMMMGFQKTSSTIGLKYDFHNDSKSRYAAQFDTDCTCTVLYSEEVIPGIRVGYCGQVQNMKDDYMFGMTIANGEA